MTYLNFDTLVDKFLTKGNLIVAFVLFYPFSEFFSNPCLNEFYKLLEPNKCILSYHSLTISQVKDNS